MRCPLPRLGCAVICLGALALLAVVGGCSNEGAQAPSGEGTLAVKDHAGREVYLAAHPQRIATTASFVVELLTAMGQPPILRPDLPEAEVPAAARYITAWAVDHSVGPNLEQLVAARPDIVITTPMFARYVTTMEERLQVPVVVLSIRKLDDLGPTAAWLGKLVGNEPAGQVLADHLLAQVAEIRPPTGAPAPRVYAIFGTPESSLAFLPNSYLGSLVTHLGGTFITDAAPTAVVSQQFTPLSLEFVVDQDPEVILIIRHGPPDQEFAALTSHPAWSGLSAVRDGRVHTLSHRKYVTNPGPSAVSALRELRTFLYPGYPSE